MIRNVRLLYIHNFLNDFRFQTAFIVIYFAQITGSYAVAMSVLALETIVSAIMDVPTGIVSDKLGRKFTIVTGSLCSTLGLLFYAFASQTWFLFPGAIFSGLSQCLFSGNNNALLYETLKSEAQESKFHHYLGRTSSMFQLALALSAFCGSFLAVKGLQFVFLCGLVPQLLSVAVSLMFKEPRIHTVKHKTNFGHLFSSCAAIWKNPRLRLLILGQAISSGAGESNFQFKTAYVNSLWPVNAVGFYKALNHGLGFIGYWFAGRVVDRIKSPYMLALAESYWFVTQSVALAIDNFFSPLIMLTGATFYGPWVVARDQLMQKDFTDRQRGTMGSVASFAGSIVFAIMAVCIGVISDHFGLAYGIGFGILGSVSSLPVFVWLFRKHF